MDAYLHILAGTVLFAGLERPALKTVLSCLQARICRYEKGAYICRQGEALSGPMALVEGKLHIQRDDHWGNRSILSSICVGDMLGESYIGPDCGAFLLDVVAVEDSTIIHFDTGRIFSLCSKACGCHQQIIQNLCSALAEKNRTLVRKMGHMAHRSLRGKLVSYLSEEADRKGSTSFDIPFNRQQLADYLSVDRSALSNELSKMRAEGMLTFKKNHFTLL